MNCEIQFVDEYNFHNGNRIANHALLLLVIIPSIFIKSEPASQANTLPPDFFLYYNYFSQHTNSSQHEQDEKNNQ